MQNVYTIPMRFFYTLCFFFCAFCGLFSCEKSVDTNPSETVDVLTGEQAPLPDPARIRSEEITASMDDSRLASQVLITGIDGSGNLPTHIKELLEEIPAGGVMLFRFNLNTDNDAIRSLISQADTLIKEGSSISPFIAVDLEGGTVNRFRGNAQLPSASSLPSASFYWELFQEKGKQEALEKLETDSFNAGREIFDLGINMNFAPVAEQLNDDNRDFLASRSYGTDPFFTAEACAAFIRGMERAGVLCVVKHFPGSSGADPHYYLSEIDRDKAALDALVYPFATVIEKGAKAMMAAHTVVPMIDSKIASLSSAVMQNWLREDLGFDGIIISDDFIMAAVGEIPPEEAAVLSIAAGADMVLVWPYSIRRAHQAILTALEDGRLPRERLQDAVTRIIYEKIKMGLVNE